MWIPLALEMNSGCDVRSTLNSKNVYNEVCWCLKKVLTYRYRQVTQLLEKDLLTTKCNKLLILNCTPFFLIKLFRNFNY